jgi:ribosomal protein S17E
MRSHLWICIAMLIFISTGCGGKLTAEEESDAIVKAKQWLVLVDSEDYEASWRDAADFLKENVTEQKWLESMKAVRKPMGSLVSRKVKSTQFRTMMPQALKGKYLIIDYQTSFSNKKSVVESITQMMGKDGKWRVAGYHLDEPA